MTNYAIIEGITTQHFTSAQTTHACSRCQGQTVQHFTMLQFLLVCLLLSAVHQASSAPCDQSKSRTAFLAEVVQGLPPEVQEELCDSSTADRLTVFPQGTGVSHFVLPGFIPKNRLGLVEEDQGWRVVSYSEAVSNVKDLEPAVLHLWLRAACTGYPSYLVGREYAPRTLNESRPLVHLSVCRSSTTVRGFGMLQGNADGKESIHGEFELDIQLVSLPGMPSQQIPLQVHWRDAEENTRFHSPFTVQTTLPFAATQTHYQIQIGGFHQHAHAIFSTELSSCHPHVHRQHPALLTVIPHSYVDVGSPAQLELVAQVLIAHVNHHVKLGMAGTVHYEVEPYLSHLAHHSGIQELVRQGTLRLLRWDLEIQLETSFGLLLTQDVWHKDRSKVLQYNHAMLAHWGMDVYINPLDNDEFLATNKPTSIAEMLANGCIMQGGHTTAMRYDVRCRSCNGTESSLWLSQRLSNALASYDETDWRVRLRGKPVLHADSTFSMSIHEAGVFDKAQDHQSYCFYHIHLVNLFGNRRDATDTEGFTKDVRWNWNV